MRSLKGTIGLETRTLLLWSVTAVAALCPARAVLGQESVNAPLEARIFRTWTPDGVTLVDGLANVGLGHLVVSTDRSYRFELKVSDSEGHVLFEDGWTHQVSERTTSLGFENTSLLEKFRFGVRPGTYEVRLAAFPTDAPELRASTEVALDAYPAKPDASDLILASKIEPVSENAGGGSWSITHAGLGIEAAVQATVLPADPELYYYLEVYPLAGGPESTWPASVVAQVISEDGRILYTTPPSEAQVTAPGVPISGHLSLAGLPPGNYELAMAVEGGSTPIRRAAPFRVMTPAAIASEDIYDPARTGYFASLSDEELARTFGGVSYMISDMARPAYEKLPPDAKRRYLAAFFGAKDPDPNAAKPFQLQEYLDRIGLLRSRYGERVGTTERGPWTLPQGRLILKYGAPNDWIKVDFPADEGQGRDARGATGFAGEPPYEIWHYKNGTGYVYLFVEENQFDAWRLIYTTDPNERSFPDWQERVGMGALRDLQNHFGIQPRFQSSLESNN